MQYLLNFQNKAESLHFVTVQILTNLDSIKRICVIYDPIIKYTVVHQ